MYILIRTCAARSWCQEERPMRIFEPSCNTLVSDGLTKGYQHFSLRVPATPELLEIILDYFGIETQLHIRIDEAWIDTFDATLGRGGVVLIAHRYSDGTAGWSYFADTLAHDVYEVQADTKDIISHMKRRGMDTRIECSDVYRSLVTWTRDLWKLGDGVYLSVSSWTTINLAPVFFPVILMTENAPVEMRRVLWGRPVSLRHHEAVERMQKEHIPHETTHMHCANMGLFKRHQLTKDDLDAHALDFTQPYMTESEGTPDRDDDCKYGENVDYYSGCMYLF